jgi:hypothetical protein
MIEYMEPEAEQMQPIQGQMPDSKEEWWVAKALYRLEIPFQYQFQLFGGQYMAGGIVIDFVVFNPTATPVEVFGNYWHKGSITGDDQMKLIEEQSYFNKEPIVLWASDLVDEETTYSIVKKRIA